MRTVGNVEWLAALALMAPAGSSAGETAKVDGRWEAPWAEPVAARLPEDVLAALEGRPRGPEMLGSPGGGERSGVHKRMYAEKHAETRQRRTAAYLALLGAAQGIL